MTMEMIIMELNRYRFWRDWKQSERDLVCT